MCHRVVCPCRVSCIVIVVIIMTPWQWPFVSRRCHRRVVGHVILSCVLRCHVMCACRASFIVIVMSWVVGRCRDAVAKAVHHVVVVVVVVGCRVMCPMGCGSSSLLCHVLCVIVHRWCQVRVYSGKGSGQVWTETDEGEGQRLDKGLVRPELGLIGFNDKGIEH